MAAWIDVDDARQSLRSSLTSAMKNRDRPSVEALRSALSAIDNAEAPDADDAPVAQPGVIAGGVVGLGAAEVPRRQLSVRDVESLIRAEISERRASAVHFEQLGRLDDAADVTAGASALEALISAQPG